MPRDARADSVLLLLLLVREGSSSGFLFSIYRVSALSCSEGHPRGGGELWALDVQLICPRELFDLFALFRPFVESLRDRRERESRRELCNGNYYQSVGAVYSGRDSSLYMTIRPPPFIKESRERDVSGFSRRCITVCHSVKIVQFPFGVLGTKQ